MFLRLSAARSFGKVSLPSSSSLLLAERVSSRCNRGYLLSKRKASSFVRSVSSKVGASGPSLNQAPGFDRAMAGGSQKSSVHDFTVKDARGNEVDLGKYKGKVLLIVNVASQCGLTNSNYAELNQLYEKYRDQGLEILAFPCNQFGAQEPGTNEQIQEFACTRFKAEYPVFSKVDVNGEKADPLYKHLKSSKGGLFGDNIKWNFSKFLVDKEGNVVDRYAPTTSPLSIEKEVVLEGTNGCNLCQGFPRHRQKGVHPFSTVKGWLYPADTQVSSCYSTLYSQRQ